MIIWSGRGFLIAVLAFASCLGTQLVASQITGDQGYYEKHPWLIGVAMVAAALILWLVGRWVFPSKGRWVVDKETGQELQLEGKHSLFFIPARWWPLILLIVGLGIILLQNRAVVG